MNDRELLEMAAKANFGTDGFEWNSCSGFAGCIQYIPKGSRHYIDWNPLHDDGDALRLAVRLHIKVLIGEAWSVDQSTGEHRTLFRVSPDDEPCQYAATRRAITRAAADLGRAL